MNQEALKAAIAITTAQAQTRPMTTTDLFTMVQELTQKMTDFMEDKPIVESVVESEPQILQAIMDPKKSIKERSVTCLVCGKTFKVLTARHLATHGFGSAEEYCEAFGLKKGTALVCKSLQKQRRDKMQSMKLWERRKTTN